MHPVPGPYRPPVPEPPTVDSEGSSGHPAVDAAIQALSNAADLPLRDQIAEYEAAHQTLQETLATIDQN
ncbi:hypothetical protein [Phytohabitans rumicis]|uniref:Uncharacterized protein n=1 Tax=Phytohabitans rumicis TaxID=1076125 RepID=A0A6V8L1E3_9ACTN|nr:hypothetical protein [Phytohabitans rumicis]GFJ87927.1 hypothetical protein Prum_015690 [Phytohabitans rumicis]